MKTNHINVCRKKDLLYSKFSLVELLITIAVIAILAGLFLPVLNKMRSKAQGIQCMNQISQLGKAAQMYSTDYDGYLVLTVTHAAGFDPWTLVLAKWANNNNNKKYNPYIPSKTLYCPGIRQEWQPSKIFCTYGMWRGDQDADYKAANSEKKKFFGDVMDNNSGHYIVIKRAKNLSRFPVYADTVFGNESHTDFQRPCWQFFPNAFADNNSVAVYLLHNERANMVYLDGHVAQENSTALYTGPMRIRKQFKGNYERVDL